MMTSKEVDYFKNHSCFGNRALLTFLGLWPYQKTRKRLFNICFLSITVTLSVFVQICVLLTMDFKMDFIIELMQTLLPSVTFSTCYYNLLYNFVTVKAIFHRIRRDWNELKDRQELIIMQKYDGESKLWSYSIAFIVYLYACFLLLPSFVSIVLYIFGQSNEIRLVLPLYFDFFLKTKTRYYIGLWLQYVTLITGCTIGVVNYSMFMSFVQHACALFSIAGTRIERPFKNYRYHFWYVCPSSREKEYEWIIAAIKSHNNALDFVDLLKSMYLRMYFIEALLALSFIIVDYLYLFELPPLTENINEKCKRCIYIVGSCSLIYAYCYHGQKLINDSTGLLTKCCEIPFYALSMKTRKMLLLLMMMSMRACNFSIRGIFVASHEIFATTLRVSLSYAMVCYKVR